MNLPNDQKQQKFDQKIVLSSYFINVIELNQNLAIFLVLVLPQDPKGEGNRLQLTPEQHQTNFQKALKTTFLP